VLKKNNVPRLIPVFFHNFSGYDSHLIVKELDNDEDNIKLIANTEEKYISFSKKVKYKDYSNQKGYIELRFLDSYRLQPSYSLN